jgi:hypothetical protein
MRHGHSVRALEVDVAQCRVDAVQLTLELLLVRCITEVHVTTKQLVTALTRQAHLHLLGRELGEKVVGDGGADQLGVVRLQMVNHLVDDGTRLIRCEDALTVVETQLDGDFARRRDVG